MSTGATAEIADWNRRIGDLKRTWAALAPSSTEIVADWRRRFAGMTAEVDALRAAGLWTHGATDLLTVCGLHRWERTQAAALAWVCDPEARHGLGNRVLRSLLEVTGDVPSITPPVVVGVEVAGGTSWADVVVWGPSWTLVVEVKVDAGEGERQCQRLYDDFSVEPDPRFVFLTKTGLPPTTVESDEARRAWRPMRWSAVLASLRSAAAADGHGAPGRPALEEWMRTLRRLYGREAG